MSNLDLCLKTPLKPRCPISPKKKNFTDEQKFLLKEGWPEHVFDYPVEVVPGLWLSSIVFDNDLPSWCYKNNFTHILNASGSYGNNVFYHTKPHNYNIKYLGLDIEDRVDVPLYPFLPQIYNFIQEAMNNDGKILVHCIWGQSRSVACLIYFMMIKWEMRYEAALRLIKKVRPCARPNDGFDAQLRSIDNLRLKNTSTANIKNK